MYLLRDINMLLELKRDAKSDDRKVVSVYLKPLAVSILDKFKG